MAGQSLVGLEKPRVFAVGALALRAGVDGVTGDDDEVAEVGKGVGARAGPADALGGHVEGGGGEVSEGVGGGEVRGGGVVEREQTADEDDEEDRREEKDVLSGDGEEHCAEALAGMAAKFLLAGAVEVVFPRAFEVDHVAAGEGSDRRARSAGTHDRQNQPTAGWTGCASVS